MKNITVPFSALVLSDLNVRKTNGDLIGPHRVVRVDYGMAAIRGILFCSGRRICWPIQSKNVGL